MLDLLSWKTSLLNRTIPLTEYVGCSVKTKTQHIQFSDIFNQFIAKFSQAKFENDNANKRKKEEKIEKQHQEVIDEIDFGQS